MANESFDPSLDSEPEKDRQLGGMLARAESAYATNQVGVARQRYRIGVAARRQVAAKLRNRSPNWIEWTARAARPLPMGIAASLLIAAASVMALTPEATENTVIATESGVTVASLAASGGTAAEIMDALIAPTTSDSLLARAFAASGQ